MEVVEPGRRRPDQPKQPLVDEKEPDDDVALLTVRLGNALLFVGRIPEASELIERAL